MPVIRGLIRFLTVAEVAEVEDGVVIIDCTCVAIFYEEGEGGEHYVTRISLDVGFRELKNAL